MISEPRDDTAQERPWERQPTENPNAFADFQDFVQQGPGRSYVATARRRGRSYSLIRRYARRFDWNERACAWDNFQHHDAEQARRTARREFAQRQEEEAHQLWRLGLALVYRFVQRDPVSGEWKIDSKLAPKDALGLLKFVSDLLARIYGHSEGGEESATALELSWDSQEQPAEEGLGITHPGLRRLLGLVPQDEGQPVAETAMGQQ